MSVGTTFYGNLFHRYWDILETDVQVMKLSKPAIIYHPCPTIILPTSLLTSSGHDQSQQYNTNCLHNVIVNVRLICQHIVIKELNGRPCLVHFTLNAVWNTIFKPRNKIWEVLVLCTLSADCAVFNFPSGKLYTSAPPPFLWLRKPLTGLHKPKNV